MAAVSATVVIVTVIVCISIRITGTRGTLAQTQIGIFSSSNAISFSLPRNHASTFYDT